MADEYPSNVKDFALLVVNALKEINERIERSNEATKDKIVEAKVQIKEVELKIGAMEHSIGGRQEQHFAEDNARFKELFVWKGRVEGIGLAVGTLIALIGVGLGLFAALT
jgi:hypothetical protein